MNNNHEMNDQIISLIIKHFEEIIKYSPSSKQIKYSMFLSALHYLNDYDLNNEISNLWISMLKEEENSIHSIHKLFRTTDFTDSPHIDMLFWHGLQDNDINEEFSKILYFISKIIKKNKYNKKVDNYVSKVYDKFVFEEEY